MALGTGREYDVNRLTVSYKNVVITEFASGDAVTVTPDGSDYNAIQGSHGAVVRSRQDNYVYTVTIRLMQGSPAVGLLVGLQKADLATGSGSGTLVIKDQLNPEVSFVSPQAWMEKLPEMKFARDAGERTFVFKAVVSPGATNYADGSQKPLPGG